jgi:MFS family permease
MLFGYLSDRYGRARSSAGPSCFLFRHRSDRDLQQRFRALFWRALVGVGMGGEWASGAVLVAENWPARHRAKGIGLMQSGWAIGYILAAILAALVLPAFGWRWPFLLGVLPALFTWWIRHNIPESPLWKKQRTAAAKPPLGMLLRPPLRRAVILFTAMAGCLLFGYWGLFTWLPTYLSTPIERGGAGLSIVPPPRGSSPCRSAPSSATSSSDFADRVGRRNAFFTTSWRSPY